MITDRDFIPEFGHISNIKDVNEKVYANDSFSQNYLNYTFLELMEFDLKRLNDINFAASLMVFEMERWLSVCLLDDCSFEYDVTISRIKNQEAMAEAIYENKSGRRKWMI